MAQGRKGREAAVQVLYQAEDAQGALPADAAEALERFFAHFEHDEQGREDARAIVNGVCAQQARLDDLIQRHSKNWKLSRMAKVDRNVLRLATWELLAREALPTKVVLNEAIELGKKFGSETSSAFINGVLDPVAREVRKP
ncbi:MAG: transcription antitermination factor NusB [Deltaproteobacteria bacterium]|nr:transcription antitermination factor NusB [Deltaproteobacteria bacterium]